MLRGPGTDRPPVICSVSVTVQLALPNMLAPGVKVRKPVAFMVGATVNRLAPELQVTLNANGSDSPGLDKMLVAQAWATLYAPESSATVTAAPAVKLGGSFTASRWHKGSEGCVVRCQFIRFNHQPKSVMMLQLLRQHAYIHTYNIRTRCQMTM